jgi:phage baseplate assembly protein W
MSDTDFLGKGWSFPPAFNKSSKSIDMLSDADDIKSSLEILLSTRVGERLMQPKFGCALDELSFEPLTTTMKTYIQDLVETAILYFEPRIDIDKIELIEENEQGLVLISIDYRIRTTNSRQNLVYPYYLNEGSDIQK